MCNDIGVADVSRCDARGIPGSESVASRSSALSPAVLLAAWLGSMASALYLALSAVLVLVWPSHAPVEGWSTVSLGVSAPSRTARVHGWVN
ncbi:hypothetical protein ACETU7_24075 [Rhodococcus sp. 3Y1]